MNKKHLIALVAASVFLAVFSAAADDTAVAATDRVVVGAPTVSRTIPWRKGVTLKRLVFNEPRLMVAFVARVDLTTPGIGFTATERDPLWGRPMPDYIRRLGSRERLPEDAQQARERVSATGGGQSRNYVFRMIKG